ncbi:MAG: hypothetical protein JXA57_02555 [Armatimonadetes bacterium]|nr:hypothetical protein [Armatimonadota bacterium]
MRTTFCVICLLLCTCPVSATVFRTDDSVTIDPGATIDDDLFVAGGSVLVAGTVKGDLFAVGDSVRVTGPIEGTVHAVGREVRITSDVDGSALALGQNLSIAGTIGRNVAAAGQGVIVEETGAISRDFHAAASQVSLDGSVGRDAWLMTAQATVRGTVQRMLHFEGDKLHLGPRAHIGDGLVYRSPQEPIIEEGAVVLGKIQRLPPRETRVAEKKPFGAVLRTLLIPLVLISFPVLFVFGAVGLALAPRVFVASANAVGHRGWWSLLLGLLVVVFGPAAVFLVMSTVVGLPIAVLALVGWFVALAFSEVPVAIFLGRKILRPFIGGPASAYAGLLVGLIALAVLVLLPVVGPIIGGFATLLGVGAYSRSIKGLVVDMRKYPA